MNSPFQIFRRHQKILMVVFTGLAMFSFIFLDSLQQSNQTSPILIGVLFGGFAMWIIGLVRGKWLEYAIIGVVGGGIAGFMMSFAREAPPRVSTSIGDFSDQDLQQLVNKRYIANQFLQLAFMESRKPEEQEQANLPNNVLFSFGRPLQEDVILGKILCAEAEKLGLVVSDTAVERFINQVTNNQLSKAKFDKVVRQDMRLSAAELFEILREQLTARLALQMTVPRNLLAPEQYWQYYQKMNVRQELVLTDVPVSVFTAEVAEPRDEELLAYFNAHKQTFPNQVAEGAPGFRAPRKVSISYLEARPVQLEGKVKEVTDEEIESYYNANKEFYRELSTNLLDDMDSDEKENPLEEKPLDDDGSSDESTDSPPKEEATEDTPSDDAPESESPKSDASEESKDESPSSEESKDNTESPEDASKESSDASTGESTNDFAVAAFSVVDDESATTEAGQDEEKKSDDAADENDASESDDEKPNADEPNADETDEASDDKKQTGDEGQGEKTDSTGKSTELSEPKYRPLDDELKTEIRNELHSQRLRQLIKTQMDEARAFLTDLSDEYRIPEDETKKMTPEDYASRVKKYAADHGLAYGEIPLSSFEELSDVDKYPMASAEEPIDNPLGMEEGRTVRVQMFESGPDQLYLVNQARERLTDISYLYWKTGDVDSHVPEFTDAGVREQVLEAWKIEKARPLAEARAKELVEQLKKDERPWEEALAETTVTGEDEGLQLTVQTTESFSWMRTSSAPSNMPFNFPQPELSTISSVDKAGDAFMKTVFQDLKDGEVGVAPNADRSVYYVVKVRNRIPSTPEEIEAQRQAFLREDFFFFFSPYLTMAAEEQQYNNAKWSERLENEYSVLWRNDDVPAQSPMDR